MNTSPQKVTKLRRRAHQAAEELKFNKASTLLESVVKLEPKSRESWTTLGHCYLLSYRHSAALQAYQQAEQLKSQDSDVLYGMGLAHLHCGQQIEAEHAFQAVLRVQPDFDHKGQVLLKLGQLHQMQKNYSKAVLFLRSALSSCLVDKAEIMYRIGLCYWKLQKNNDAVEAFREAARLNNQSFQAKLCLGWSLFCHADKAEAQRVLQKAGELATTPTEKFQVAYWLARCHLGLRNFRKSQAAFQLATSLRPNVPSVWNSVGVLYAQAGQLQNAFDCFAKAVKLGLDARSSSEDLGRYWANLAVLFTHSGSSSEAERAMTHACSLDSAYSWLKESSSLAGDFLDNLADTKSTDPFLLAPKKKAVWNEAKTPEPFSQTVPQSNLVLPTVLGLPELKASAGRLQTMHKLPTMSSILSQAETKAKPLSSPRLQPQPVSSDAVNVFSNFTSQESAQKMGFGRFPPQCNQHSTTGLFTTAQCQSPSQLFGLTVSHWTHRTNPISGLMRSLDLMSKSNSLMNSSDSERLQKRPPSGFIDQPGKKK